MSRKEDIFDSLAMIPDHGIKTMSDKGVRVMIDTNELVPSQMVKLFKLKGMAGRFVFAPADSEEIEIEIPELPKEFKTDKSPSERLRNVLYVIWKQGNKTVEFSSWYNSKIESIIDKLKEQIND